MDDKLYQYGLLLQLCPLFQVSLAFLLIARRAIDLSVHF